jgi:chromosome segregation ATPase
MLEQKRELEEAQRQRFARLEERARTQDKVIARLEKELLETKKLLSEQGRGIFPVGHARVSTGFQRAPGVVERSEDLVSLQVQLQATREALDAEQKNRRETERLSEKLASSFDHYLHEMERRLRLQEDDWRRQESALRDDIRRCKHAKAQAEEQLETERESLRAAQQELVVLRERVERTLEEMNNRHRRIEAEKTELERRLRDLTEQAQQERRHFESERERFMQASREAYAMLDESAARSDELEKRLSETQNQMQQLRVELGSRLHAEIARSAALERDLEKYRQRNHQLEERVDEILAMNQKQAEERNSLRAEIRRLTDELVRVQARSTYAERRLQDLLLEASSPRTDLHTEPRATAGVATPLSAEFLPETSPASVSRMKNIETSLRGISEENAAFRARVRAYLDKRLQESKTKSRSG